MSYAEDSPVIRSPPPAKVVRSGRVSAFWPRPGLKVCEQLRGSPCANSSSASSGCSRSSLRSAVPCWPAPGGNPGECAPGLRRAWGPLPARYPRRSRGLPTPGVASSGLLPLTQAFLPLRPTPRSPPRGGPLLAPTLGKSPPLRASSSSQGTHRQSASRFFAQRFSGPLPRSHIQDSPLGVPESPVPFLPGLLFPLLPFPN